MSLELETETEPEGSLNNSKFLPANSPEETRVTGPPSLSHGPTVTQRC